MRNKLKILKGGVVIYFLVYLLISLLSFLNSSYSIISSAMTLFFGVLLIIFRREAIIILDDHRNSFKRKHPNLGQIYNPGIVMLLIGGATSALLWLSLIGVWVANVSIWLVKVLRTSLGFKGPFLLHAAILPFALVSAVLFALPFILIGRRSLLLSPIIFIIAFLLTYSVFSAAYSPLELSYLETLTFLASDIVLWFFVGLFILFAWQGARIRNATAT
jgi:hypothetical protein